MAASMKERRAVPDYIDDAAKKMPHDTWAIVPRSSSKLHQGWDRLTFSDLAGAVNNMAWWIEKNIGLAQQPGNTIGYMGYVSSGRFPSLNNQFDDAKEMAVQTICATRSS
jgi:hypothetical protein